MNGIDDLIASLDKAIGTNASEQSVTDFIDTGYAPLNKIVSGRFDGGLPFGRLVEMYGYSSSGKTALATQWMVQAQKLGGVAIFIDWERSFDLELAKGFGLNDQRPYWIYQKPTTWEQGNIIAAKACQIIRESKAIDEKAPILVVFDSIASAIPQSMIEKEIDEYTMNDTTALARVASTTLKTMAHHAQNFNATFLYLNQIRMKPGVVYGDPTTTPGGSAMEFYSTVRIKLTREKIEEAQKGGKQFVGQTIKMECVKSKLTRPFQRCELDMVYDDLGVAHFDPIGSTLNYLTKNKIIPMSGAWIKWSDGQSYQKNKLIEKIKAEGGMAVLQPYLENPTK